LLVFRVSRVEAAVLILVISSVLVLELLNTVLEKFIDVLKPRVHYFVEIMKDLMAAAVLVASIAAFAIGLVIFLPHLIP
jgi:diacylglycerol kinase